MARLVLTDFYADWCGPCRMQGPIFDELKSDEKLSALVEFRKINVDNAGDLAMEKAIMVVPTIILERDGNELERWTGVTGKDELIRAINRALQ